MTNETYELLVYLLAPPTAALVMAGIVILSGNYRSRQLDRKIGRDAEKAGIHLVHERK